MFVIKSLKTGKTFIRVNHFGGHDWVMFREEEPTQWETAQEAIDYVKHLASLNTLPTFSVDNVDVVPLFFVPYADTPIRL